MLSKGQNFAKGMRKRTMTPSIVNMHSTKRIYLCRTLPTSYSWSLLVGILLLTCLGITPGAYSATYYLAPNGTNSNFTSSSSEPWQTFAFALPKLKPGDTLTLKDGTYTGGNSGYPEIDCSRSEIQNGTSTSPITIKAENERRPLLYGDGYKAPFYMLNCSNWKIEGLHVKNKDNTNSTNGDVVQVYNSTNVTFKRLLLTHNNRFMNSSLLSLSQTNNILVEESEFYYFHRHAILSWYSNNNTFRRNYFNSRLMTDVTGGFRSTAIDRGDIGISNYPSSYNIVENNISENNQAVTDVQAKAAAVGNQFLGNISLNDHYGIILGARGVGNSMPIDTKIENLVVINPTAYGILARGAKNTQVKNISVLGGNSGIVADYEVSTPGDGSYSIFSKNALVNNISTYGFRAINQTSFSHKFPSSYDPQIDFSPNSNYSNERTDDPKLGTCKIFIPQTSPLKGKGEGGADIGANILYRYEKGVLTNQPLWNTVSGDFPHGALVPGVNDIAGSSAFDVHKRLNVNANGCTFTSYPGNSTPDSGGSDTVPPASPTGMTLTIQ